MPALDETASDPIKQKKDKATVEPTARRRGGAATKAGRPTPVVAPTTKDLHGSLRDQYQGQLAEWQSTLNDINTRRAAAAAPEAAGVEAVRESTGAGVAPPIEYKYTPEEKAAQIVGYTPNDALTAFRSAHRTIHDAPPGYLDHRLKNFDPAVVNLAPGTVYSLAFNNSLHGAEYNKQVQSLNTSIPFLMQKDQFGTQTGLLMKARTYANLQRSPELNKFLDQVGHAMTFTQQDAWIRYMKNPEPWLLQAMSAERTGAQADALARGDLPIGWTNEQFQALQQGIQVMNDRFGIRMQWDTVNGGFTFLMDDQAKNAVGTRVAINQLFPNSSNLFQFDGPDELAQIWASGDVSAGGMGGASGVQRIESVFNRDQGQKTLKPGGDPNNPGDYVETGGPPRFLGLPLPFLEPAAKGGNYALALSAKPFVLAGEVGKASFGGYGGLLAVLSGSKYGDARYGRIETQFAGIGGAPMDLFNDAFAAFDAAVHLPVDLFIEHAVTGVDADTQTELKNVLAGFTELFLLNKFSEASRAAKEGRTLLPDTAKANLGIEAPLLDTEFGGSNSPLGNSPFAHPLQAGTNLARRVGYELGGFKTLAEALDSPTVKRNLGWIRDMVDHAESRDAAVGSILKLYNDAIPIKLAWDLTNTTTITEMQKVFLDYSDKTKSLPIARKTVMDRLVAQKRRLEFLTDPNSRNAAAASLMATRDAALAEVARGVTDGAVIDIPARILQDHVINPERTVVDETGAMRGRTAEQTAKLRENLRGGYDQHLPTALGGEVGPIEAEYNPATHEFLVREGHHRIGLGAEMDLTYPVRVKLVDNFEGQVGTNIPAAGAKAPAPIVERDARGGTLPEDLDVLSGRTQNEGPFDILPAGADVWMGTDEFRAFVDDVLWDPATNMSGVEGGRGHMTRAEFEAFKDKLRTEGFVGLDAGTTGDGQYLTLKVDPETGEAIASEGWHKWQALKELAIDGYDIQDVPVKIEYESGIVGAGAANHPLAQNDFYSQYLSGATYKATVPPRDLVFGHPRAWKQHMDDMGMLLEADTVTNYSDAGFRNEVMGLGAHLNDEGFINHSGRMNPASDTHVDDLGGGYHVRRSTTSDAYGDVVDTTYFHIDESGRTDAFLSTSDYGQADPSAGAVYLKARRGIPNNTVEGLLDKASKDANVTPLDAYARRESVTTKGAITLQRAIRRQVEEGPQGIQGLIDEKQALLDHLNSPESRAARAEATTAGVDEQGHGKSLMEMTPDEIARAKAAIDAERRTIRLAKEIETLKAHRDANPAMKALSQLGSPTTHNAPVAQIDPTLLNSKPPVLARDVAAKAYKMLSEDDEAVLLRLGVARAERDLIDLVGKENGLPLYELPKASMVKKFFVSEYVPDSLGKRIAENVFVKPLRTIGRHFVDELPRDNVLYSPDNTGNPRDWREHNAETMNNYFERAGVPKSVRDQLVGELTRIETRNEMYLWQGRAVRAIDNYLPRGVSAELRAVLTHWHEAGGEGAARLLMNKDYIDATTGATVEGSEAIVGHQDPMDPRAKPDPRPSAPSEFVGVTHLPDVERLIEATSTYHRVLRRLDRDGSLVRKLGGHPTVAAANFIGAVLGWGTTTFKSMILGTRIPAMMTRMQLEQAFRSHAYAGAKGVVAFPGGLSIPGEWVDIATGNFGLDVFPDVPILNPDMRYNDFTSPHDVNLGSLHSQVAEAGFQDQWVPVDMSLVNRLKVPAKKEHFQTVAMKVDMLHKDPFDRVFASVELDPARMKEKIAASEELQAYINDQQLPQLRDSTLANMSPSDEVLVDQFLKRRAKAIRDLTFNDPDIIGSIGHGKVRADQRPTFGTTPQGVPYLEHLQEVYDELDLVQGRMNEIRQGRAEDVQGMPMDQRDATVKKLVYDARRLRQDAWDIEHRYGVDRASIDTSGRAIRTADINKMAEYLKQRFDNGEYKFPNTMTAKKRYTPEERRGIGEAGSAMGRAWNRMWYTPFKALSWADTKATRGGLYLQLAERYKRGLETRGYAEGEAASLAEMQAAKDTRDIMYDLAARTSMQRAVRNVFWFAPAAQEILYTWAAKIPSKYLFGTGYFLLPAKVKAFTDILKAANIIQQDGQGNDVIHVPWVANMVDTLLPGEQNFGSDVTFGTKGFNFVTQSPFGFSPATIPAYALAAASRNVGGPFKTLNSILNSFGSDIQATPRQISYAWEALTGTQWPLEIASPEFAKAQYDRAMDQSLQWAYSEQVQSGHPAPRPEDFKTVEGYQNARDAYQATLMQVATDYFKGVAWTRLAGSTITPASLYVSETERTEWAKFFTEVVDPAGNEEKTGTYSEKQRELIDSYVGKHPNSLAYTIGYTAYGEKKRDLPYTPTGDTEFYDKLYTGEAKILTPEQFSNKLLAVESYRFYTAQKNAALADIGTTAGDLLSHGSEKLQALTEFTSKWNKYLAYNTDASNLLDQAHEQWASKYGIPQETYEVHRISQTAELLNEMSAYFTGETGMRSDEFLRVEGELKALYSENGTFGTPTSAIGKQMAWYYDSVLTPYFDQTQGLYDQANTLTQSGQDASAVYDQIKAINDNFVPPSHNGESFPTPEMVFFGNKNPAEQQNAILSWQGKPPTYLDNFQLDKAGIVPAFAGRDAMLRDLNSIDQQVDDIVVQNAYSYGSKEYEALQASADTNRAQVAAKYGPMGQQLLAIVNMTPAQRLTLGHYGTSNSTFTSEVDTANIYVQRLTDAGLSPRGTTGDALFYKADLYNQIIDARSDPAVDKLWTDLGYTVANADGTPREGVPLYEAILFGNFRSDDISPQLIYQTGGTV